MKVKKMLTMYCLLLGVFVLSPALWAAETPPATLPPQAQEAFDKGMAAVGQQQWTVAIRNFLKAQKAAPEAPEVLFNLGLTEVEGPGGQNPKGSGK
jgi:hypothetical protein